MLVFVIKMRLSKSSGRVLAIRDNIHTYNSENLKNQFFWNFKI